MKELVLTYPDDLAQAVRLTPDELSAQLCLMAALKMFELGKPSSGKAAELAGLSPGSSSRPVVAIASPSTIIPMRISRQSFGPISRPPVGARIHDRRQQHRPDCRAG